MELPWPQESLFPFRQVRLRQLPPKIFICVSKVVPLEHVDAVRGRPVPSTMYHTPGLSSDDAPPHELLPSGSISALSVEYDITTPALDGRIGPYAYWHSSLSTSSIVKAHRNQENWTLLWKTKTDKSFLWWWSNRKLFCRYCGGRRSYLRIKS